VIYYRVKLYDIDGAFKYSNIAAVRLSSKQQVTAWPNPFQTTLNVSVDITVPGPVTLRMTDLLGKTVRMISRQLPRGKSQLSFTDLENLPPQMYMLEMIDESGYKKTIGKYLKL
jgi:hypothetical protein